MLQSQRGRLCPIESSAKGLELFIESRPRGCRRPPNTVETVQDPQQLMMPELEGCGGEEEHPLERVAERTLEGCRVFFGLLVREQPSELVLVLDVMCFVKDEQWQVLVELPKALRPRLVEGQIELTTRRIGTLASAYRSGARSTLATAFSSENGTGSSPSGASGL
jgi:hypothetical protein